VSVRTRVDQLERQAGCSGPPCFFGGPGMVTRCDGGLPGETMTEAEVRKRYPDARIVRFGWVGQADPPEAGS